MSIYSWFAKFFNKKNSDDAPSNEFKPFVHSDLQKLQNKNDRFIDELIEKLMTEGHITSERYPPSFLQEIEECHLPLLKIV